jgi:hypothetical protein
VKEKYAYVIDNLSIIVTKKAEGLYFAATSDDKKLYLCRDGKLRKWCLNAWKDNPKDFSISSAYYRSLAEFREIFPGHFRFTKEFCLRGAL